MLTFSSWSCFALRLELRTARYLWILNHIIVFNYVFMYLPESGWGLKKCIKREEQDGTGVTSTGCVSYLLMMIIIPSRVDYSSGKAAVLTLNIRWRLALETNYKLQFNRQTKLNRKGIGRRGKWTVTRSLGLVTSHGRDRV